MAWWYGQRINLNERILTAARLAGHRYVARCTDCPMEAHDADLSFCVAWANEHALATGHVVCDATRVRTPYPEFCTRPACEGLGSCPKDPNCAD